MKVQIKVNDSAPDFSAPDQDGKLHKLSDYKGKNVLLYFYPKDNTPGCTIEACSLRDNFSELKKELVILGVSGDSQDSHKKFADKFHLPFTLLSDPEKKIIGSYGTDGLFFAKRTSFLIGKDGKILKVYEKVVPSEHAVEILSDLKLLAD